MLLDSELGLSVCYLVFGRKKKEKGILSSPWAGLKLDNVLTE